MFWIILFWILTFVTALLLHSYTYNKEKQEIRKNKYKIAILLVLFLIFLACFIYNVLDKKIFNLHACPSLPNVPENIKISDSGVTPGVKHSLEKPKQSSSGLTPIQQSGSGVNPGYKPEQESKIQVEELKPQEKSDSVPGIVIDSNGLRVYAKGEEGHVENATPK